MNRKSDRWLVLVYGSTLIALAGLVLWLSRPASRPLPEARALRPDQLETDRQVVYVRVDSLTGLLDALLRQNAGAFTYEDRGNSVRFMAGDEAEFDQLFLGGHTLAEFARLKNTPIRLESGGYGFAAPVTQPDNLRLVGLPAHVIQSLQVSRQP